MKKFNIPKAEGQFDIMGLLYAYKKAIKNDSYDALEASIDVHTKCNQIKYYFTVRYAPANYFQLFKITLLDLEDNVILNVKTFSGSETFNMKVQDLEKKIDEIISSEETGKTLNHLIKSGLILNKQGKNFFTIQDIKSAILRDI